MSNAIDMFDQVKNVEFMVITYNEEIQAEIPSFKLKEPSTEEWNKKARIQNTKMFIQINKKMPQTYQEVLAWIYDEHKESHSDCGTVTFS
ncbi:hypothetical protein [Neobacillus endophyticus]|uniref:hypothetical protein n=1 Tax=Neobacillus endophyticus TaxID=2738405 RepID=UPI001C254299|nr:hypothetical protein [Neobacillus endophyticus]